MFELTFDTFRDGFKEGRPSVLGPPVSQWHNINRMHPYTPIYAWCTWCPRGPAVLLRATCVRARKKVVLRVIWTMVGMIILEELLLYEMSQRHSLSAQINAFASAAVVSYHNHDNGFTS
jgi:hypothetical protein